jgi:ribulose-bisphosphate carboxylase small chain
MRITQGTFSYLPDLTDEEIVAQAKYAIDHGWAALVEFTDDPHPRNAYWEMWGLPMFDLRSGQAVLEEVNRCREAYPDRYVRCTFYDPTFTRQTTALQFIVQRPAEEPGFRLDRQESHDRVQRYAFHPYATDQPEGQRYRPTRRR